MTLELRVLSGARTGTRERFDKSVVAIGRHPLSDFRFDAERDLDVSTRHAELRRASDAWMVHDLASTNGTFLNGERVTSERRVHDGDTLRFGPNGPELAVVLPADQAADQPAAPATVAARASVPPKPPAAERAPTPRRPTEQRIAEAVQAETKGLKRWFIGALGAVVVLGVGAFVWTQRQATERELTLRALLAQAESASVRLQQSMGSRDSLLSRELAARVTQASAPTAAGPRAREAVERDVAQLRQLGEMDLPRVHDANDPAIAMLASDLDGSFVAGTAFGVTPEGLLVTNRHVVQTPAGQPPRRVRVIFGNTRTWLPARVVRTSDSDDLALLQVETPGRYPVVAGVSRDGALARVGAAIASIGYPLAVDTPMEGAGLQITARSTTAVGTVSKRLDDVIQIDSYAGKGSSGSPVFDARGRVVGVIYGGAPESNGRIVYAVPAQRLAAFLGADGAGVLR